MMIDSHSRIHHSIACSRNETHTADAMQTLDVAKNVDLRNKGFALVGRDELEDVAAVFVCFVGASGGRGGECH